VKTIVTVTLNPAIDETIVLEALTPGHVHRAVAVARHAGGKGVNVASCLADWGCVDVSATGFIGSGNAGIFEALCAAKGVRDLFVRLPGETRTNIKLAHDGDTTDINLPGLPVTNAALGALREVIGRLAGAECIVLLGGSLPPGVPGTIYAELLAALRPTGARVLLDTSGAPLTAALGGDVLPFCIKPNRAELEAFCGRALPGRDDVIVAAQSLRARGIALVVISLGAEGALFVGEQVLHAALPALRAASTVGAGDAMVAGMIAAMAENADLATTARLATAFAVGKLGQAGPNLPARDILDALAGQVTIKIVEGVET
jgi:1-phosphofructokinase